MPALLCIERNSGFLMFPSFLVREILRSDWTLGGKYSGDYEVHFYNGSMSLYIE